MTGSLNKNNFVVPTLNISGNRTSIVSKCMFSIYYTVGIEANCGNAPWHVKAFLAVTKTKPHVGQAGNKLTLQLGIPDHSPSDSHILRLQDCTTMYG